MIQEGQFALIETYEARIICHSAERMQCGIRLSECSDGYVHECMSEVRIFDFNEMRQALIRGGLIE